MKTIIEHGASNYSLDTEKKQITFLDARFYMSEAGPLPSVTTILDAYPKGPEYYAWLKKVGEDSDQVRDEAGRRGSRVHKLTEQYDAGEEIKLMDDNGFISMKLSEWAMFERYVQFRDRHKFEILMSEQTMICPSLGIAGTLDRLININGKKVLVDIKTSNAIYPSYWLQLAAYEKMLFVELGIEVDEVAILWLNAKTKTDGKNRAIQGKGWQLVFGEGDREKQWSLFQSTQQLWNDLNEDLKPRELSYNLSYQLNS